MLETALADDVAHAVREGLTAPRKHLPPRLFYDAVGSSLFERICELDEYYVTRAEDEILAARAWSIAGRFRVAPVLVELGSGSAAKTRHLIRALLARHGPLRFVAIDVSRAALESSSRALRREFPALEITGLAVEYAEGARRIARERSPKLVLWLGSNAGNLEPKDAGALLARVAEGFGRDDAAIVGLDLDKDRATLERAYDDARGVTARFNRNVLERINRELGGRFDLRRFRHLARYDDRVGRVEMHLVSEIDQTVRIDALGLEIPFRAGESIHTENSYKFTLAGIDRLARTAGLVAEERWLDANRRFCVAWMRRAATAAR
ncbi:MAG TPA: L-histidine N(alpha)-methyltransferase [Planctomycetota bacterium]|nr:L-histidine N(alpha)-methyltransferase [Planctomycetota bacterium]